MIKTIQHEKGGKSWACLNYGRIALGLFVNEGGSYPGITIGGLWCRDRGPFLYVSVCLWKRAGEWRVFRYASKPRRVAVRSEL
jgi:hypothetical protein